MSSEDLSDQFNAMRYRVDGMHLMHELLKPRAPDGLPRPGVPKKSGDPFCNVDKCLQLIPTADLTVRSNEVNKATASRSAEAQLKQIRKAFDESAGYRQADLRRMMQDLMTLERAQARFSDGKDDPGNTLLITSILGKHDEVRRALQPHVDPNERSLVGNQHPAIFAYEKENEDALVDLILDPRTKLQDVTDGSGHDLWALVGNSRMYKAADALHERNIDAFTTSTLMFNGKKTGETNALRWALENTDPDMIRSICRRRVDTAQLDETLTLARERLSYAETDPEEYSRQIDRVTAEMDGLKPGTREYDRAETTFFSLMERRDYCDPRKIDGLRSVIGVMEEIKAKPLSQPPPARASSLPPAP